MSPLSVAMVTSKTASGSISKAGALGMGTYATGRARTPRRPGATGALRPVRRPGPRRPDPLRGLGHPRPRRPPRGAGAEPAGLAGDPPRRALQPAARPGDLAGPGQGLRRPRREGPQRPAAGPV